MDYYGIGFSNIRLPNDKENYIYKYNSGINTFPEEVFIHEFLHSLERNLLERQYDIPQLHDNEKYGYKTKKLEGLKSWYEAYMTKTIKGTSNERIGLNKEVYAMKPVKKGDFNYSYKLNSLEEPKNRIEEIKIIIGKMITFFK